MKTLEEVKSKTQKIMKKPELLAPAGNLEKLKIAVHYGADAVFLGAKNMDYVLMLIILLWKRLLKV